MGFAHLHVHDQYSLLDGMCKTDELVQQAKALGQHAIALTNHGNANGLYHFQKECDKNGIKAILGIEFYMERFDGKNGHLIVLAKNNKGLENIFKLQEYSYVHGFYYKPRITFEKLREHAEGLIVCSACLANAISQYIIQGDILQAKQEIRKYKDVFGDDFYLELQANTLMMQEIVNRTLVRIAEEMQIKTILTNDVHYVFENDWFAHEVLLALQTKKKIDDEKRFKFSTQDFWLKSEEEMCESVKYLEQDTIRRSIETTLEIAEKCTARIEAGNYLPPYYKCNSPEEERDLLELQVQKGIKERIESKYEREELRKYKQELQHELEVIDGEGYSGYHLIVQDYVTSAKNDGNLVGPGRGSGAGCKVAYTIGITDVDPEPYHLLFERFMAKGRTPDYDTDFFDIDAVFDDLQSKYGADSVARIIAFGTLAPRAVVRKVLNCFGATQREIKKVTSLIAPLEKSLEHALELSADLREYRRVYKQEFDIALRLEGLVSHESQHAGGVIIYPQLSKYLPTKTKSDDRNKRIVCFDKYMIEELGFYKFDILGLETLPIIHRCLNSIEEETGERIDLHSIDLEDSLVYDMLCKGDTSGVFQLISQAHLLLKQQPKNFRDIVAINALLRPGGEFEEYVARKNGKCYNIHPDREWYMKETFGVIAYQEQFLLDCKTFAGWSIAYADKHVRKNKDIYNDIELEKKFICDSVERGYEVHFIKKLWNAICKSVDDGYAFNKSHAVCYAILAYWTAWLKVHYPIQWYASLMTSKGDDQVAISKLISECKRKSIEIHPPNINASTDDFIPSTDGILYRITTIKHVGDNAIKHILQLRREQSIQSLEDLITRREKRYVNDRAVRNMIKAGCFDFSNPNRAELLWELDMHNRKKTEVKNNYQCPKYDWNKTVKAEWEKEVLGMYLSVHPMEKYSFKRLEEYQNNGFCLCGGEIVERVVIIDKNGNEMAFIYLDTLHGQIKVIVFASQWSKPSVKNFMEIGDVIMVRGKRSNDDVLFNSMEILD